MERPAGDPRRPMGWSPPGDACHRQAPPVPFDQQAPGFWSGLYAAGQLSQASPCESKSASF